MAMAKWQIPLEICGHDACDCTGKPRARRSMRTLTRPMCLLADWKEKVQLLDIATAFRCGGFRRHGDGTATARGGEEEVGGVGTAGMNSKNSVSLMRS